MVKNVKMEIIVKNYIYLFTFVCLVFQVLGLQACTAIPGVCGGGGGWGLKGRAFCGPDKHSISGPASQAGDHMEGTKCSRELRRLEPLWRPGPKGWMRSENCSPSFPTVWKISFPGPEVPPRPPMLGLY